MNLNKESIVCCRCGRELSMTMIFYDNRARRYCYDCFQATAKRAAPVVTVREKSVDTRIKTLYNKGKKPSEIADLLKVSAQKVYEVISRR